MNKEQNKLFIYQTTCVLSNQINLYFKEKREIPGPDLKTYNFWKIGAFLVLDTFSDNGTLSLTRPRDYSFMFKLIKEIISNNLFIFL